MIQKQNKSMERHDCLKDDVTCFKIIAMHSFVALAF